MVVTDPVERRRQIGVQRPAPPRIWAVRRGEDRRDCVGTAPAGPKSVGPRLEPGLPLRFQRVDRHRLAGAVDDHGNADRALLGTSALGDEDPPDGTGGFGRRPVLDLFGQFGRALRVRHQNAVDTRCFPSGVDLRDPPHTHQCVRAGAEH